MVVFFFLNFIFYFINKYTGRSVNNTFVEELTNFKIKRLQPNTFNAVRRKRSTRSQTDRKYGGVLCLSLLALSGDFMQGNVRVGGIERRNLVAGFGFCV